MTLLAIDTWNFFVDIVQILLPALIVFLVTYFTLKKMLDEDFKRKRLEVFQQRSEQITPMKLQAYERLTIFLERIRIEGLILRNASPSINATEFKHRLLTVIQDEFNHNVSQQIYISDQAWSIIVQTKNNVAASIEMAYNDLPEAAMGTELGKKILSEQAEKCDGYTSTAIHFLKKEIDLVF